MKFRRIMCSILLIILFLNTFEFVHADILSSELTETSSETENSSQELTNYENNENEETNDNEENIDNSNKSEEDYSSDENFEENIEENSEETSIEVSSPSPTEIPVENNEEINLPLDEELIEDDNKEESFIMINLVGLKLEENIYEQINILEENVIINYEINDDIEENLILEQSIKEGEVYTKDSLLELKVSSLSLELDENKKNDIDLLSNFSLNEKDSSISESNVGNSNILLNWDGIPCSYEYNWDNSSNCWYWGVWIDGICYKTPEGEYSTDVRHKMQLYCDNEYVYLHIIYSRDYGAKVNANDFQFFINGEMAAFQVEDSNRNTLANQSYPVGTHSVFISHRNNSMSYSEAEGSEGYLIVDNEENINNQLEIKIPLSELARQNSNINLDNMSMIEFFTPNLMYRRISCSGSNTFGIIILIPIFILISLNLIKHNRKKKSNEKL